MDTPILILVIVGITALITLSVVLLYFISLIRRTNIVMKKVDYLVEDVTYKSESLNVAVEAVNKISNYVLSFDTLTKKGYKSLIKLLSENRNYFYEIAERLKTDVKKKQSSKPATKTTAKKPAAKKPVAKKTTTKK
jgi:uncharacterized protein YoxC